MGMICSLAASAWAGDVPAPSAPPKAIWLRAVGDIMLDRGVARGYQEHDMYAMFDGVRHLLRAPDITFGNLENPVTHGGRRGRKKVILRAHPMTVMALEHAGFDVLALGNNHSGDYGLDAVRDTRDFVERRGIVTMGAEAWVPTGQKHRVIEKNGLRIAFISYMPWGPKQWTDDAARLAEHVAAAKKDADFVISSFHWGDEYVRRPNDDQRRIAREAVTAGVDLVIGHHPHVTQGIEVIDNVVVAYSLGNFLFDLKREHTQDGLLLDWRATEHGDVEVTLYPTRILLEPPRAVSLIGKQADKALASVAKLSKELGTELEHLKGSSLRLKLARKPKPLLGRSPGKKE